MLSCEGSNIQWLLSVSVQCSVFFFNSPNLNRECSIYFSDAYLEDLAVQSRFINRRVYLVFVPDNIQIRSMEISNFKDLFPCW